MNSQTPLRVVVAGLGNMGRSHALAYHTNPGFEIAALVNRSDVPLPDRLAGYHVVTYWLLPLTLGPGAPETIELTDRNVWFTGVVESRDPARLPDQPFIQPR